MEILIIILLAFALLVMFGLYSKLRGQLETARRSNCMMRAFLKNYSSEVRSPLKTISDLAATVAQDNLYLSKNEKRDLSDQLRYSASHISTLLDEVMVFTDSDVQGHQLKDDTFSPNTLCRRCLEANMHNVYQRSSVRLNFQRELSDEFFVKSDRHVVELILNKLILMACRFTEQGDVTVGCSTTEYHGHLTIFVSDTGRGIPEQRRDNLFTWFETPSEDIDEAELDLSICQRLAHKLGGELRIDPLRERGTRVLLVLPLK